jgi:hypothetical protein
MSRAFSTILIKTRGFMPLAAVVISDYDLRISVLPDLTSWPARGGLATPFGQGTLAMAHALDELVRLDRRWFWAHPQRQHRCRSPDPRELELCDCKRGARLVIAIRHLGRGYVIYQPVVFQGALPAHEESAAALFALAATCPAPVPVLAQKDVLRMRRGLRAPMQSHEASNVIGGVNGWGLVRNAPRPPSSPEMASAGSSGELVPHP